MKKSELVGLIATPLMMFALSLPAWADSTPTTCKDGTTSTSTGKGTCSGHGGIQKAGTSAAPAAPAPAAAPAAPAAPAASGAPSTCKDGTTSTSTGKGTCSGHGGVQKAGTRRLRRTRCGTGRCGRRPLRLQPRRQPSPRPLRARRPL